MSRSKRKHSITGITTAESEKKDKVLANRKYRRRINSMIDSNTEIIPEERELSNIWCFSKDGKQYISYIKYSNPDYYDKLMRK